MLVSRHRYKDGHSLIETLVTLGLLGLLIAAIFGLLSFTTRGFGSAVQRQGLSGEMERIQSKLLADFQPSHYNSVQLVLRDHTLPDTQVVNRDGVSFVGLRDWSRPESFAPSGLPLWDQYLVYYASLENPGRLIRQVVDRGLSGGPLPYFDLVHNISDLPDTNASLESSKVLSENVLSFKVERNDARLLLDVSVKLRGQEAKQAVGGGVVDETQEAVFSIDSYNTFPRL